MSLILASYSLMSSTPGFPVVYQVISPVPLKPLYPSLRASRSKDAQRAIIRPMSNLPSFR